MNKSFSACTVLLTAVSLNLVHPASARATATASSELSFNNLSITPSAGTLVLLTNWQGAAFAQAGVNNQYNSGTPSTANAAGDYSLAQGGAAALTPLGLSVNGSGSASANVPGQITASDDAAGRGSIFGSFMITGGSGPVDVLFSATALGSLSVFTDTYGESAQAEATFALEVSQNPALFTDHIFTIGPSDSNSQMISDPLTQALTLNYNTAYPIWLEADAEAMVSNIPEPTAWTLLLAGLGLAWGAGRRRSQPAKLRLLVLALVPGMAGVSQAMYIGSDAPNPCAVCACRCTKVPGGTVQTSLTEGDLREDYPVSSIKSQSGSTLDLGLTYNSYNADGSKAQVDTGLGLGWTHSYNIFLFQQRGHFFRMDADGRVTQYFLNGGGTYTADTGYFESLTPQAGGTYIVTNKQQSWWQFSYVPATPFLVAGPVYRLIQMGDRNQNVTSLSYSNGLLVKITDTYGRSLKLGYTNNHKLSVACDPLGRATKFQYDPQYRTLVRITDPDGNTVRYTYNSLYQLTRKIDRDGRTYLYLYKNQRPFGVADGLGQMWFTLSNPDNWAFNTYTLAYSLRRQYLPTTTTYTNGLGNVWKYSYDTNGYLTQIVDPLGDRTTYSYDPATRLVASTTNAIGAVTRFQYDAEGNRTNATDALGNVTRYTYEPIYNQMTSLTDPNGRTTTYHYDSRGNRTNEIDPLLQSESWSYDAHGNVLSYTDKRGFITTYQYDSFGDRTNMTDPLGNTTAYTYDAVGNRASTTDALGRTTTYTYDGLNRLIGTTNALGGTTSYVYDGLGRQLQVTDPNTNSTSYDYDVRGRLAQTTDALGDTRTYTYDPDNNRIATTNELGQPTTYFYDAADRLTRTTNALGGVTSTFYDGVGNTLSVTDPNSHTTYDGYDTLNRRIAETNAIGSVTQYDYALPGGPPCCSPTIGSPLVTEMVDGDGKVTFYRYDELDRLVQTIHKNGPTNDVPNPNDAVITYTYDPVGNRLTVTDPVTNTTVSVYDADNRKVAVTNAAGDTTLFMYDPVGNLLTRTEPNGDPITSTYDALNRVITSYDEIGLIASNRYDAVGNQISSADANGNTTSYTYDGLNRMVSVTDALGNTGTIAYDALGNLIGTTDRLGNSSAYTYDELNRRVGETNALGNVTTYTYDPVGNLLSLTDANSHTTTYTYDPVNRPVTEVYPDTAPNSRTNAYDAVGNLLSRTDQKGQVISYSYNDLYFVTNRHYQPSGTDDRFTYDLAGRMLSAERGGWVDTFAYDGANRLITSMQNGRTLTYEYNIPGRVQTNLYPSGRTLNYTYDARNRLTTLGDTTPNPPITTYTYDGANRVVTRTYRNGTVATYTYNPNNWVTSLEHTLGLTRIAGFGYNYDAEGNKFYEQKRDATTDSQAYTYDPVYRLTNFNVGTLSGNMVPSPTEQKAWLLDPVGNWGVLVSNGVPQIRTHGPANELTSINANPLTYDADGNLVQDPAYTYAYDEANRLVQVTRMADLAVVGQYSYDGLGRRIIQITDPAGLTQTNIYYYDVGRIIEELDGTGATQTTYTYGNNVDEVLTMDRGGQTYYYHQNTLWSPAAVTDSSATVQERYTYDAYGQVTVLDASYTPVPTNAWGTPHSAIGNPWLFTGRELEEETGLYFYRARYYDPGKGRFLQRDPKDYDDGPNLYMYVQDRPTRFVDPAGTQSQQCTIKGWKPLQGSDTRFPLQDKKKFRRGFGPVLLNFGYDVDIQASECESCCGDGRHFTDKKLGASISFKAEISVASYAGYFDLGGADFNFWFGAKGTVGASASVSGTFQSDYCKGVGIEGELCGNVNIYGSLAIGGEASVNITRWWSANVGVTGTATLTFPGKACFKCNFVNGCSFESFKWQRPRVDFTVSACLATLGCVSFSPPSIEL
jgi:RHS repeat-associated protein